MKHIEISLGSILRAVIMLPGREVSLRSFLLEPLKVYDGSYDRTLALVKRKSGRMWKQFLLKHPILILHVLNTKKLFEQNSFKVVLFGRAKQTMFEESKSRFTSIIRHRVINT